MGWGERLRGAWRRARDTRRGITTLDDGSLLVSFLLERRSDGVWAASTVASPDISLEIEAVPLDQVILRTSRAAAAEAGEYNRLALQWLWSVGSKDPKNAPLIELTGDSGSGYEGKEAVSPTERSRISIATRTLEEATEEASRIARTLKPQNQQLNLTYRRDVDRAEAARS
jgi:hypothetical protein